MAKNATIYGETLLIRTLMGEKKVSVIERCPLYRRGVVLL